MRLEREARGGKISSSHLSRTTIRIGNTMTSSPEEHIGIAQAVKAKITTSLNTTTTTTSRTTTAAETTTIRATISMEASTIQTNTIIIKTKIIKTISPHTTRDKQTLKTSFSKKDSQRPTMIGTSQCTRPTPKVCRSKTHHNNSKSKTPSQALTSKMRS